MDVVESVAHAVTLRYPDIRRRLIEGLEQLTSDEFSRSATLTMQDGWVVDFEQLRRLFLEDASLVPRLAGETIIGDFLTNDRERDALLRLGRLIDQASRSEPSGATVTASPQWPRLLAGARSALAELTERE
jgi:hypothetical protein